jgi:uncharacterized repeat protein (TIGR02543 family)
MLQNRNYCLFGFIVSALLALAFTACDLFGKEEKYTVTFNSNGGSEVRSQTVARGGTVTRPADPATTEGGATLNRFRGWYLDNGTFERAFNFNSRITQDITLYADWGYRVGDTGPGTGRIFYRDDRGFEVPVDGSGDPQLQTYTAYYLEAAPRNSGNARWDEAANLAGSSSFGGRDDWYLPALGELQLLRDNKGIAGISISGIFWSSSQADDSKAWLVNLGNDQQTAADKGISVAVRAIRAF